MEYIDSEKLKELISAGYTWLKNKSKIVDDLNVFPVPDGDTGKNMCSCLKSIIDELSKIKNINEMPVGEVSKIIAISSLMGARGNSGVILSQFFYGFSEGLDSKDKITLKDLAEALNKGSIYAYKGVSSPVEGTILTVMRETAQAALEIQDNAVSISLFFEKILKKAKETLNQTPQMLPILKEAGVVDSGGCGFVFILEGMLRYLKGKSLKQKVLVEKNTPILINTWVKLLNYTRRATTQENNVILQPKNLQQGLRRRLATIAKRSSISSIYLPLNGITRVLSKLNLSNAKNLLSTGDKMVKAWKEKPSERYCLEFVLHNHAGGQDISKEILLTKIEGAGNSAVIASARNFLKVHIHTNDPEKIINTVSVLGKVSDIKIDDMHAQQEEFLSLTEEDDSHGEIGIIVVASGKGWKKIFQSFGASYIIDGRATMNPSVAEILKGIEKVRQHNILLLPNDENVLLSAEQAVSLTTKNVKVIPSKTMPEGLSSLLAFNPEYSLKENKKEMERSLARVTTGKVTKATRQVQYKDLEIEKGDFIGLCGKDIITKGKDYQIVALDLTSKLITEDSKLITVYWGKDVHEIKAKSLYSEIQERFPNVEVQLYQGGQLYYYYLISVE